MKPVEFHPSAMREVARAYRWYADRSDLAAGRFAEEMDQAVGQLSVTPERFPKHMHGMQRFLMDRFPYLLIYRELKDRVRVVAVAHAKQRPGYWDLRK